MVLQKLRLDQIICRHSTDPDIAAACDIKYPTLVPVSCQQIAPAVLALQSHIAMLAEKLEISDIQKATLSSDSLILLANEAAQNIRTAHSIGDTAAKDSWSEKYRTLVQTLTCVEAFESMADCTVETGMTVLNAAVSDVQGKGRILRGALDGLCAQLEQSVSSQSATPNAAATVTKLASLQSVLKDERHRMSQPDRTDGRTFLSQQSFKALVLVVDDNAAARVIAAVQP